MNRKLYCCLMAILAIALLTACGETGRIIPPDDDVVEVRIESPENGAVFYFGEFTPCEHRIVRNTGGFEIETTWTVGDNTFSCGVLAQILMVQDVSPPEELVLTPGTYQVELMARAKSNHSVFDEDVVTITIIPQPSYITYTAVTGNSRDFCRLNLETKEVECLTNDGGRKLWPEISPDGTKFTYVKDSPPCFDLPYTSNLDGSGEVRYGWGPTWETCMIKGDTRSPRWSPDGQTIVTFGAWQPNGLGTFKKGTIFLLDIATGEVDHIDVRDCDEKSPPCIDQVQLEVVWAPDGKSFYTTLWENLNIADGRIHVVRIDFPSLAVTRLYTSAINNSSDFIGSTVYDVSRDGRTLSIRARRRNGDDYDFRLVLLPTGGGELQFITPSQTGKPGWPTFCEVDGEEWIFYVDKERRNELRRIRKDSTGDEVSYAANHDIETIRCQDSPDN